MNIKQLKKIVNKYGDITVVEMYDRECEKQTMMFAEYSANGIRPPAKDRPDERTKPTN